MGEKVNRKDESEKRKLGRKRKRKAKILKKYIYTHPEADEREN